LIVKSGIGILSSFVAVTNRQRIFCYTIILFGTALAFDSVQCLSGYLAISSQQNYSISWRQLWSASQTLNQSLFLHTWNRLVHSGVCLGRLLRFTSSPSGGFLSLCKNTLACCLQIHRYLIIHIYLLIAVRNSVEFFSKNNFLFQIEGCTSRESYFKIYFLFQRILF
jgi:hypothetical protein